MALAPTVFAQIQRGVAAMVDKYAENDPTVVAYMIARCAVLQVRGLRGAGRAGELAYRIADEMACEGAVESRGRA